MRFSRSKTLPPIREYTFKCMQCNKIHTLQQRERKGAEDYLKTVAGWFTFMGQWLCHNCKFWYCERCSTNALKLSRCGVCGQSEANQPKGNDHGI